MKQKAVFLDRDGVINVEKDYLYKREDFEFIDGLFEALRYLQSLGFKLFIITNQSGIGRGYYKEDDFKKLTVWMVEQFKQEGIEISQVEYCPHAPEVDCSCRKPKTGMIEKIASNFKIDFPNSWIIGDKQSDIECGKNSNIGHSIQVKSGHSFLKSDAEFVIERLDYQSIASIILKEKR
ncbi:MAG: D-glycero-beta-D-manno-heptose 1,7-bisphosphate 7-phosphatase [Arcobacteraceae bacterium]|nr:D-glycero-beta-D-manno-heptose 1,7-bisphosphate 7-phosphatase [Arcobacteraceae bacterium]